MHIRQNFVLTSIYRYTQTPLIRTPLIRALPSTGVGTEPHRSKGVATVGASPQIDVGGATAGVALRQEVKQEEQKEGGGATSGVALLNS